MTSDTGGQFPNSMTTVRGFTGGQLVLGRYTLQRVLGQGGMGIVWLARDEQLNRDVALKFLPDIVLNDRASLDDLKKETRRSLDLTHPHIVRTYDFVQDATTAGISMEYVDCDTLRNLRIDQPGGVFQPSQLGEWVNQLCGALDYAHLNAGIVHRDLKPANLMVNSRNQLKIADFGIARSLVDSLSMMTAQRGVSGTLVYMSPQQLSGEHASPSDDIYATGAALYDLLTSRPPFYAGDISGQIHGKVPPRMTERRASLGIGGGDLPENWERTIASCLAKEPGARPRTAGEIAVNLGLAEAASVTRREPAVPPPPAPAAPPTGAPPPPPPPTGYGSTAGYASYAPPTAPPPPSEPAKRQLPSWLIFGIPAMSLGLVILGVAAFWFMGGKKPSEVSGASQLVAQASPTPIPTPAPPQLGGLIVNTDPPGAMVTVGNLPARKSPAAFSDVPAGAQTVQVTLDGYDPMTASTTVAGGKIDDLGLLTLQRSKGPLSVISTPPGLPYVIKFKADPLLTTTGSTPMSASEMPSGDYDVTVTRDGWPPQEQTVTVVKGQDQQALFNFPGGTVSIKSDPAGAKVLVGGTSLGVTPLDIADAPPGAVTYSLQLSGYEKAIVSGTLAQGATLALESDLTKIHRVVHHTASSETTHHSSSDDDNDNSDNSSSNNNGRPSIGEQMKEGFTQRFINGGFGFPHP